MLRADAQVTAADRVIAAAGSPEAKQQAESAKAEAAARVAEIEAQLAAARAGMRPKLDAVASSRQAALAAESARAIAEEAVHEVARELDPVSVFISRKTQRLYVRRAFQPILESPVTIEDPDHPIGTHVFTAMERTGVDGEMHWTVVSLRGSHADAVVERAGPGRKSAARESEPLPSDAEGARNALDRIAIPQDVLHRIADMASPRSSLIISDEALSPETGKGTEFVVIMSGEPQGGIKFRRRGIATEVRYDRSRPRWLWPFANPRASW